MNFFFDHDVPDDLIYVLEELNHRVVRLREALSTTATDAEVLRYAVAQDLILVTCNRDDFVSLATTEPHRGIVVLFRRRTRAAERAALVQLVTHAGEQGLAGNITFA